MLLICVQLENNSNNEHATCACQHDAYSVLCMTVPRVNKSASSRHLNQWKSAACVCGGNQKEVCAIATVNKIASLPTLSVKTY